MCKARQMTEPYSVTQPGSQLLLYKVPAIPVSIVHPGVGGKGTQKSTGKAVLKARVGLSILQHPSSLGAAVKAVMLSMGLRTSHCCVYNSCGDSPILQRTKLVLLFIMTVEIRVRRLTWP